MTGTDYTSFKQSRVAIVLPYAVSIRDFVNSGALETLVADNTLSLTIYTINPELPELERARKAGVVVERFIPYSDSKLEAVLKHLYLYAFTDHFSKIAQQIASSPRKRFVALALVTIRRLLGTHAFLTGFEKLLLRINHGRRLPPLLVEKIDLVIGTRSLLNSIDYGVVAEARSKNIPILILASSWDNFTTKGYFPFKARQIVVWNQKMKSELVDIFEVPAGLITIAGYPRRSMLLELGGGIDAPTYLKRLGYGDFGRFVLYSASYSALTQVEGSPYPLEYEVMAQVSRELERVLPSDVCILLRLHPFSDQEGTVLFEGLNRSFVFVPGRRDQYLERVMGNTDEADLARQLALSECIVSMASTMTIDALSLGKPIINTCFDPWPGLPPLQSTTRFYQYDHLRDLIRLVRIPIATRTERVVDFVMSAITGPMGPLADMEAFETLYVPKNLERYSEMVSAAVKECLS